VVTVFFLISGVGQALSGFLVDRVGARPVLYVALACFVASALLAASAQGHAGLLLASAMAGLGNAPFHPVDFTILNRRVSPQRLGHAYSVHGISGNLGWAVSPLVSASLMHLTGSLRLTYGLIGLLGLAILALVWWRREDLDDRAAATALARPNDSTVAASEKAQAGKSEHPLAFLRLPAVWLCFSFLFWTTCALSAVQSFVSPALQQLHALPLAWTTFVVTGYMVCGALGMVAGGFLLARVNQLESLISLALLASAGLLLLAASPWPGGAASLVLASVAGLGTRSEERRVGKECRRLCRSRWSPYH
jgi:predicted MFS family arabinose efflux permease